MKHSCIYLDNNATTRPATEVVEAMLPYIRDEYGNPSSPYSMARTAALAVDHARHQVSQILGVEQNKIVFTSGGTESNAMAILGSLPALKPRDEVILSSVEHASVRAWSERLSGMGYTVRTIPVDREGQLDLDAYSSMLSSRTALVSVMAANNETGIMYPIKKITAMAHSVGARMHTDIVQAVGKIPVQLADYGIDYAAVCGHKYHAVKGIGCLYIREPSGFEPRFLGGEQEFGRRPGTEPVASIVALGAASEIASAWLHGEGPAHMTAMRDAFELRVESLVPGIRIVGQSQPRLPNTSMLLIDGVDTEPLLALLDMEGLACSSGSACASGAHEPSLVLAAMGLVPPPPAKQAVLRVSSSRYTREQDYAKLADVLPGLIAHLKTT